MRWPLTMTGVEQKAGNSIWKMGCLQESFLRFINFFFFVTDQLLLPSIYNQPQLLCSTSCFWENESRNYRHKIMRRLLNRFSFLFNIKWSNKNVLDLPVPTYKFVFKSTELFILESKIFHLVKNIRTNNRSML